MDMEVDVDSVTIRGGGKAAGRRYQDSAVSRLRDGFAAPLSALLTQAEGKSTIRETIYPERFKHCMGATDGRGYCRRPGQLHDRRHDALYGDRVTATDLRRGSESGRGRLVSGRHHRIHEIYHIERGYDDLDGKLRALGANIWRETIE